MRERKPSRDKFGLAALAVGALLGAWPSGRAAGAEDRPKTSAAVQVQAQGGSGLEPVAGAPPAIAPSLETRVVAGTLGITPSASRAKASLSSLRALSTAEGEASLELGGVRETVRPGSRLGRDTVKAVSPGRLVLERPKTAKEPSALVIVTFDEAGRAKERVFWTSDPTVRAAPRVSQP